MKLTNRNFYTIGTSQKSSRSKQLLAGFVVMTFLMYGCSSQPSTPRRNLPEVFPESIGPPLDASIWIGNKQIKESIVVIAREWPNDTGDGISAWYSDDFVPESNSIVPQMGLEIRIPTSVIPESIYYWFYTDVHDDTGIPQGQPKISERCIQTNHACVSLFEDSDEIVFQLPYINETGTVVVQFEWIAPQTNSKTPLVARVSWAFDLLKLS